MIYLSVTLKCGKINVGKKTVTSSTSYVTDGVRDARMLLCSNARFTFPGSPNHHLLVNSCLHCVAAVEGKGSRICQPQMCLSDLPITVSWKQVRPQRLRNLWPSPNFLEEFRQRISSLKGAATADTRRATGTSCTDTEGPRSLSDKTPPPRDPLSLCSRANISSANACSFSSSWEFPSSLLNSQTTAP